MPNKHYKVGYSLEMDVKKALEQQGYTVFRSAGSHSMADLIAMTIENETEEGMTYQHLEVKLVQCKRHRNLMTQKEIKTFYDFATNLQCIPVVAYRDKGIHMEDISL